MRLFCSTGLPSEHESQEKSFAFCIPLQLLPWDGGREGGRLEGSLTRDNPHVLTLSPVLPLGIIFYCHMLQHKQEGAINFGLPVCQ